MKLKENNEQLEEEIKLLKQTSQRAEHTQNEGECQVPNELAHLQQKIDDLEETIAAKDSTIQELSEFMNEQAIRISQFEEQTQKKESKGGAEGSGEQIAEL